MNDQDIINEEERHEAATEEPITLGCPSLGPAKVVVHDEPAEESRPKPGEMPHLKMPHDFALRRFANKTEVKLIGKFRVADPASCEEPNRVCEIVVAKQARPKLATVSINGNTIFVISGYVAACCLEKAACKALKACLSYRLEQNRHKLRNRKRRAAAKRAQQQEGK